MWLSGNVVRPGTRAGFSKAPPRRVAAPGRYRRRRRQPNEAVLILVLFLLLILVLFYFS